MSGVDDGDTDKDKTMTHITFKSLAHVPSARKTVSASGLKSAAKVVLAAIAAATFLAAPMIASGAEPTERRIVDRKTCVAVVSFETDSKGRTVITKSWSCEKIENAR